MSVPVTLTAGNLPPNPCYTSEQARYNAFTAATQASLPPGYTTVIVSMTAPGPDDRDKSWLQVDGSHRIVVFCTFANGQWRRASPAPPYLVPGEYRWYDPSLYTPVAPWFPCDGTVTGVAKWNGRMMVASGTRDTPAAQTFTNADGSVVTRVDTTTNFVAGATGGEEQHVI